MKRNYSLDLLKLYFAAAIAVSHAPFGASFPVIASDKIVMLFFVLSGFFLVSSFDSGKYAGAGQYTWRRLSRIYPYYAFAFVASFVYMNLYPGCSVRNAVLHFFRSLPELFLLNGTGIFSGPLNYPVWHICCLVMVSHIFFGLLVWNRQLTLDVICPTLALVIFSYLTQEDAEIWGWQSAFVYLPMVRAVGGIALGMLLNGPVKKAVRRLEDSTHPAMPAAVTLAVIPLLLIFWTNRMTLALLIPYVGILICLLCSKNYCARLLQKPLLSKLCSGLDRLSLLIYVNHSLILRPFDKYPQLYENLPIPADLVFLAIVIVYSLITGWLIDQVIFLMKKQSRAETM